MVLESIPREVYGLDTYTVTGGAIVGLIVVIGIVKLVRSRSRVKGAEEYEEEFLAGVEKEEEKEIERKPREDLEDLFAEDRQKYEAKIQQLTNLLNVERDKLKAKEAQFQQQSSEFLKVSALKDEVEYLQKRIGELEKEKNALSTKHEEEIRDWEEKLKEVTTLVEEEKEAIKAEFEKRQKEMTKKYADEIGEYKKEIEDLKAMHLTEKEKLERDYEKRLGDEKRRYEDKIQELKDKTKDAIQKVIREKEDLVGELREENERLKKDIERLKERIRLLEVEHL
jgi:uncharacterized phage infection (PIP) family protein YhgE